MRVIELKKRQLEFALFRSAICGDLLSNEEKLLHNAEILPQIAKIAKKHDLLHLLVLGMKMNELIDENTRHLEIEIFKAVYRYEQLSYELNNLCEAMEKAKIPYIPLKGSVMRKYYPEPWMRTSCDIDVLVHTEDLDKAISYLVENLEYKYERKNSHDISMFTKSGIHIELHYDLVEDGIANESAEVLKNVWNMSTVRDGYTYLYEISDEYYYFYHIAHMAKHFQNGGCGIRPFIDLWILDGIQEADKEKRDKLLQQGNLLKFANAARKLSRIWFENGKYDFTSQQMEDYILRGGVYGNNENRITVQQQKKGGKIKYSLSRIVLPYDTIKFHYPILQKYCWLTPFMQVRRWFKLIFCGHAKMSMRELSYNSNITQSQANEMKILLDEIGL